MPFRTFALLPLLLLLLSVAASLPAAAASIAEPPLVVFGKVFKTGSGGRYQLFSGTLHVKLVNSLTPSHVLELVIPLRQVGASSEFSYRTSISQETAPAADQLATTLVVSSLPTSYLIQSATLNGYPAELLDPSQAAQLTTSFSQRGQELRLDFKTELPLPDSDGDGMPDWWESRYALNPLSKNDAALDPDGDGLSNLQEFLNATDPNVANTAPGLQDSLLVVTAGGSAGIYLPIVDTDTPAANLRLTLLDETLGLNWLMGTAPLRAGTEFSYADVLAGKLSVNVAAGFQKAGVRLSITDLNSPALPAAVSALQVEAFSPNQRWLGAPDVWLDAGSVARSGPVEEWTDRSTNRRDGYQPFDTARPLADGLGRMAFNASQFLYVDDREIQLGQFTAFMAFELGGETAADQTLFSSPDLEVSIGGPDSGIHGRSLSVVQNGRTINGPVVGINEAVQLTLSSAADFTTLRIPGQGNFGSRAGDDAPLSTFTTVGARQPLSSPEAEHFLKGALREVLIYNRPLTPANQGLIEDYQMSRWQQIRVWNYRNATLPVKITGATGVRHSISGGEGDDELSGGDQADILRGGMGNNRLTGKAGADRFRFSKTGSNDVIADFSASTGDSIDLTELFAGMGGLPSKYVKVKTLVTRGANNLPRVDTRLELIYSGTGTTVDQTITLEGVGLGSSDLPRLVGEGNLQLGGPRYDSVISLAISAPDPTSPGSPRKLTVLRSGNTSAAIQVALGLGGDALVDADYQIVGSVGTGSVRSVPLARGATQAVFNLVPASARSGLTRTVAVTALPVPQVSDGGASVALTLQGASTFAIQTLSNLHPALGRPGLVEVSRTGGLDQAVEVPLVLAGTLVNGVNCQPLPTSLHFAAGQESYRLTVTPLGSGPAGDELPVLKLSLAASPLRYHIGADGQAAVLWVTQGGAEAALSFAEWCNLHFPGRSDAALESLDGDGDGRSNLLEYLASSDPTRADATAPALSIHPVAAGFELRWASVRALTDVRIGLDESAGLGEWADSPVLRAEKREWQPDGRIRHSYRFSAEPAVRSRFFRLRPQLLPAP
jgi:hypothetical protein